MPDQITATCAFPPGFLWGTATAAYQVEGGHRNSWTAWEDRREGRVYQNQVSGRACEWWSGSAAGHATGRAEEDFDRAAGMHNNALRLSVEWSRIEPEPGRWDDDALARYREMMLALRARGLEPMVTLHHFTNPLWLEERGGWLHEDTPIHFARFAAKVAGALGDQVRLWCTINEPLVYATYGWLFGHWPPGQADFGQTFRVVANLARGHAEAYYAIKGDHPAAQIGFAKHQVNFRPGPPPLLGRLGARWFRWLFNELFFGPFTRGRLRLPWGRAVPMPRARHTLDWVGLQYYHRQTVCLNLRHPETLFFGFYARPDVPRGPQPQWGEFAPREIGGLIEHLWRMVRRPIYVTEAGVPDENDSVRPAYLARTLRGVWEACASNIPVRGFFYWSLVDNFEWAEGYDPRFRFGLFGVDFATQARVERPSAQLYREVCAANALSADMVRRHAPNALPDLFSEPRTYPHLSSQ